MDKLERFSFSEKYHNSLNCVKNSIVFNLVKSLWELLNVVSFFTQMSIITNNVI